MLHIEFCLLDHSLDFSLVLVLLNDFVRLKDRSNKQSALSMACFMTYFKSLLRAYALRSFLSKLPSESEPRSEQSPSEQAIDS